jgi:hypothetical protein
MRTWDCFLLLHFAVAAISLAEGQRPDSKLSANQQQAQHGRRKGRTKSAESASKAVTAAAGVGGMGSGDAVIAAAGGGSGMGSGAEYLQLTETEWDGKSPWFTGSRK